MVWRSLLNAPPVAEILRDVIAFVSNQQQVSLPDSLEEQIETLLHYLQNHRCLIAFDNVESVLQSGDALEDGYRPGYEGLGELFKRIGTTAHQSCLLINSREKPIDVSHMEGINRPVRSFEIGGMDEASGRRILDDIGSFTGVESDWSDLVMLYSGNPLALELAAKHVSEVFFGDISRFMAQGKPVFNGLQDLLDWHINRLSEPELEVLVWLAIDREPVTLVELEANILRLDSRRRLPSTIQSLQRRVPLERASSRFSLQPVIIEHLTNQLIEGATRELITGERNLLHSHALLKALARDYVRETQVRLIANPIVDNLKGQLGGEAAAEKRLREYVGRLRDLADSTPSYAAGNVINLLCRLTGRIERYDFSGLNVRQAYLQEISLNGVSFAHSAMADCAFTQTFGPISCLALSPNGELVAASASNGDIHIWRLADLQVVATLRGHINWIFALVFSPDGRTLASGGEDKVVRLWDLETGQYIKEFREHTNSVWATAFSPRGNLLATGSEDRTIKVWNLATGRCIATMADHERKVFSLDFSPDGQRLASGSADHTVKVWNIFDWTDPMTLTGHTETVRGVRFSPDSRLVASCSWDKTIKLWEADSGDCVRTLRGHTDSVHSVAFHPGGQTLASSGESGAIRIWSLRDGACLTTLARHRGEVWKIEFSQDGQILVSGGYDTTLRIWDTRDWVCRNTLHGYIDWVQALAASHDGRTLVASYGDLTIKIWDVDSGACLRTLRAHTGWTFSVDFSPDGLFMATGSDDRTIKIWDTRTWTVVNTLTGHANWVQVIRFSTDGRILASGSDDRTIKLWDAGSGECLETLTGHTDGIWSLAFTPDGKLLASAGEDKAIKLWRLADATCVRTIEGHEDRVHAVSVNPAGTRLATCSDDKTVRVWDIATGEPVQVLKGHGSWVISAVFDGTGKRIWSGGKDRTLRVWDTETGECVRVLRGHAEGIWAVVFNERREYVATASEDGSIRLCNSESGAPIRVLRPPKPYEGMNIFGVTGLTEPQMSSLRVLGAVEEEVLVVDGDTIESSSPKTHDYAKFAGSYSTLGLDGTFYLAFRDIPELLARHGGGTAALDYGCGPGRSTRFLKSLGYATIGADINPEMLGKARQLDPFGKYRQVESAKLPFEDASFDVVFSSFVFIEVPTRDEIVAILREMKRVLKPDGRIVVVTDPADGFEGDWVSFSYDFPENYRVLSSGEKVKLQILGTDVVLYDYYWSDGDYRSMFDAVGLGLVEKHLPMGRDEDPVEWRDEKERPFIVVYVVGKDG
nr:NB-ARC domain-containing protein [Actinoplanes digitatis]